MSFFGIIRNLHVLSAAIWLGMVVVMNFGLMPSISKKLTQTDVEILKPIFKKGTNLVSISAFLTFVSGGIILWIQTKFHFVEMLKSTRGMLIFSAGGMGFVVTLFHFLGESKLEKYLKSRLPNKDELLVGYKGIEFIPRIGLVIITTIFITMLIAVRGF
ncbi:MAG: hypothetical protein IPH74_02940 [Bacteroidetes bacterium]|jgi:uncharacterized membrane protein|nr:hypothetical protein [Bacteroidota bacterium]MBP7256500.1 hypothetical protein [Chitinophagales bacterium]MBK7504265.1 hypothetical protein [Bacteroidota bacterium]MBK8672355.1 hypothetical protein [Bacteroidota bacterium]MBK9353651.1 hypothetical protein [Bacteroidota bacterium]